MALIARYTGWGEKFIMWKLPLARAHAYAHAFMRMQNVKTELVCGGNTTVHNELLEKFDSLFPRE